MSVAGAAVAFVLASQLAVYGEEPGSSSPAPTIAAESTDEDAPEKAATAVPAPPTVGTSHDQLTVDEVGYARYLASQTPEFAGATDLFGEPGAQYISTNVSEPASYTDGARRFDLLYYDYTANQLIRFVTNLTTKTVESTTAGSGSQPAPTDTETIEAFRIALADPLGAVMKEEFTALTGGEFTSAEQTEYGASSFSSKASVLGAENCGAERCVQIVAQTPDGTFLSTSNLVVNLSTKTVVSIK
ncbi:hypothetical protein [Compostimonas suwonensis]|uniref:hypothetical protein n=1 Tax=Compostimonas suwonensis TaxID=1048394 RepID=UPI000C247C80|nr:hypothetical protein [Compostimonas suwonensis]